MMDAAGGMLDIAEDDVYQFDAVAADRVVRFIETICSHFEGRFAGQPFTLAPIQRKIVRDLYGWKERATGYRRFSQAYIEAAAGAGKSPLLAALGLYGLIADGEQGAQVYSVASNYSQARVVFDAAKRMVEASPKLAKLLKAGTLKVTQYEIAYSTTKSYWRIVSGKGPKAGLRPSLVLADELHEWPTREVYDSLQGRMTKRTQPLFICATNAGESRASLCWQLHEEAEAVLRDPSRNPKLYPVIWAAPKAARIDDPEAWRAANPLLGTTVTEAKVRDECHRAKGNPTLEARFRRLYLSQWVQGTNKWLDLNLWDACSAAIDPDAIREAVLYVGLDLSQGDDLCAAVYVYVTPDRMHVRAHFWLPKVTADEYERDGIPYRKWAEAGHLTLTDGPTIGATERQQIAAHVIAAGKAHKVKAVAYDRYKADEAVAALEGAGLTCLPIAQGYTVTPGCAELDRRLKERSVTIDPNPVLRACAEIVEVKTDERGNFWPVKPNAKGRYAGKRAAKIDGISALVTALVEARRHTFPRAQQQFRGLVVSI